MSNIPSHSTWRAIFTLLEYHHNIRRILWQQDAAFFLRPLQHFFCGLWHGFCKIWKITGSPPEINFRADSGGRIPPKQIIYVRSGGDFFCCRTKNDKHSCHFSSKLLKSRPFCSPLKPETIKNGWNHPPHTEKNCLSRWSPSPPVR